MTELATPRTLVDWAAAADPARRVGHAIEFHAEIGSTNDRARALLDVAHGVGRVVVADLQTSGRGRQGRVWLSPRGANLTMSVGLRLALPASRAGWLGVAVALAACDACAAAVPGANFAVRWPNDIVDGDGRKVAGMLIETASAADLLAEAVVGIGINANWRVEEMPPGIAARAISLADLGGGPVDRVALLSGLLDRLDAEIAALGRGSSPIARLRERFWLTGRSVTVERGGYATEGVVRGVDAHGALLLETAHGDESLTAGEVVAVRDLVAAS